MEGLKFYDTNLTLNSDSDSHAGLVNICSKRNASRFGTFSSLIFPGSEASDSCAKCQEELQSLRNGVLCHLTKVQ